MRYKKNTNQVHDKDGYDDIAVALQTVLPSLSDDPRSVLEMLPQTIFNPVAVLDQNPTGVLSPEQV